jgi:hypothetical protein
MFAINEVSGGNLELLDRKPKKRGVKLLTAPHEATPAEQRRANRYSLKLDLTYVVLIGGKTIDSGAGQTVDCSSAGLRFVAERPIGAGRKLEIAVRWPLTLDSGVPLKLVITGKCVRADNCETAIRIAGYEFRTRGLADERRTYRGRLPRCAALERESNEPSHGSTQPWSEPWVARGRFCVGQASWPVSAGSNNGSR